jgi:hypothetical protein
MRRSFGADRGQKQGASYLLGFQNNPQKIWSTYLRTLITEAYPISNALRATHQDNYRTAAQGLAG